MEDLPGSGLPRRKGIFGKEKGGSPERKILSTGANPTKSSKKRGEPDFRKEHKKKRAQ